MKRATKDSIVLLLAWKGFGFGIFFIAYGFASYFYDITGFLTPYMIWGGGVVLIIGSGITYFMVKERKRRYIK